MTDNSGLSGPRLAITTYGMFSLLTFSASLSEQPVVLDRNILLVRSLRWALSGFRTFVIRYGIVLVAYAVLWPLLRVVTDPTAAFPYTDWVDTLFFAGLALAATIVWTAFALGLHLWLAVEAGMGRERIEPALGFMVLWGIAFAACAAADQLVDGLRPCLDHFVLPPSGFFFCILTRGNNWVFFVDDPDGKARIQPWPSDDLMHYALLAILALVIIGTRFAFRCWRGG